MAITLNVKMRCIDLIYIVFKIRMEDKLTHPQLLEVLKCESKWKAAEEEGVGARSLAHNTWGVEGRVGAPGWD
jgi:hypothetical protein